MGRGRDVSVAYVIVGRGRDVVPLLGRDVSVA